MTPKKERALQALIVSKTKTEAAKNAGIAARTLNNYLKDPKFIAAYEAAYNIDIKNAERKSHNSAENAVEVLKEIMNDTNADSMARISAAKAILEFALNCWDNKHTKKGE